MSRNQVLIGIVVLALLALGAGYYFYSKSAPPQVVAVVTTARFPATGRLAHRRHRSRSSNMRRRCVPHCAHFNADVIPHLNSNYIDTGKVYYVFRVFPIGAADVPAEALARCQPADNYFQFIDLLFRNQAKWDPENGVTDVHAASGSA